MLRSPIGSSRGISIAEVLISGLVFSMLTVVIFSFFRMALTAWSKTDTENTILSSVRVAGQRIIAQVQESSAAALTVAPTGTAISLLSARDRNGQVQSDTEARLLWQGYRVHWWDRSTARMMTKTMELTPSIDSHPLPNIDLGSGQQPLVFYCTDGRIDARSVALCEFRYQGRVLKTRLIAAMKRKGQEKFETLELEFSARPRN